MGIADFIAEHMTAYITGGMKADTAAHYTRGELLAIYKGDHRSRDSAGNMQTTQPPEKLPLETAAAKCDAAISAFLSGYNGINEPQEIEPQTPQHITRRGLDALRHYCEQGIALLPCIQDGSRYKPITKKENWTRTATADIKKLNEYIQGGKHWTGTGADNNGAARLFRFIPKDYSYVVIDIDRGHNSGDDGENNFYKWLENADIHRPQLPSYLQNFTRLPCFVTTPSGGLHLYFKATEPTTRSTLETLDTEKQLNKNLTDSVELFYSEPITAAGSEKENGKYVLYGDITAALELPPILLRRIKKPEKIMETKAPQWFAADRPQVYPQTNTRADLEQYRPRLVDYLHAKGYTQKQGEFIPCLCHADGKTPNMFINADYLYCHSCKARLDVFGAAAIIAGIGNNKTDFPKVIDEVKRAIGA